MTEGTPALLIGAVLGDATSASMHWSREIGRLSRIYQDASAGLESAIRLNVVFHVSGEVLPNEFAGVRTGRYNKKDGVLVVQATVERDDDKDREATLLGLLVQSVAKAEEFARTRRIADGLPEIRRLVTS